MLIYFYHELEIKENFSVFIHSSAKCVDIRSVVIAEPARTVAGSGTVCTKVRSEDLTKKGHKVITVAL